jgi:glycosyltransferase involved in cell wall biosynthesis
VETILAPLGDGPFVEEAEGLGLQMRKISRRFRGDPLTIYRLFKIINEERVGIVHTHGVNGNFYGRIAAGIAGNSRLVTTVHAFYKETMKDKYRRGWIRNLIYRQDILTSKFCDSIIAVNGFIMDSLIAHGVNREKIVVIPNGVEPRQNEDVKVNLSGLKNSLCLTGDEKLVVTAGRLSRVKNVELLLNAGKRVVERVPRVKFIIVGDGPRRHHLEELTSNLGMASHVMFVGWQKDIKEFLSLMDTFVTTSLMEGASFAILEAMALAKPVIATNVGGNPELIVAGKTGYLVQYNDVNALASSIINILTDKQMALRMGKAGRKRVVMNFQAKQMIKRTKDVYTGLLGSQW